MVEQYDVKMIVMLTQLVERGRVSLNFSSDYSIVHLFSTLFSSAVQEKCHQYFPAIREIAHYDKLAIKCTSELDYRTYTQRTLLLQKVSQQKSRLLLLLNSIQICS